MSVDKQLLTPEGRDWLRENVPQAKGWLICERGFLDEGIPVTDEAALRICGGIPLSAPVPRN